jgi:hypothetical protein
VSRLFTVRMWASVGVLILAAGTPYCAAALGWAATQDDKYIYVREDVAMGIVVSWVGVTVLAAAFVIWLTKRVLRRAFSGRAPAPSRASASPP